MKAAFLMVMIGMSVLWIALSIKYGSRVGEWINKISHKLRNGDEEQ